MIFISGFIRGVILGVSFFLYFGMSILSEQPRSILENQNIIGASSKVDASEYISGTDITLQLRNDLNSGLDVNLPDGHFYVSETIIVQGYSGTVKGVGKNSTIIEAAQGYKATEDPAFGPGVKLTEMFAIYWSKGDVTFKDMTLLVTGEAPAELHNNPYFGMLTTIDNAIVVAGVHAEVDSGITVTFENLKIKGECSNDSLSLNGKNLALPLISTGLFGDKPVDSVIKNCEIENSGYSAIEYFDVFGGSGLIIENEIVNCFSGITMLSYSDSLTTLGDVTIKNNRFSKMINYTIKNMNTWSSYCLKDNTLDGVLMTDDCK